MVARERRVAAVCDGDRLERRGAGLARARSSGCRSSSHSYRCCSARVPPPYDFVVHSSDEFYSTSATAAGLGGSTTVEPVMLTSSQRLLILSLAEHVLRQDSPGRGELPSSADAAARLLATLTTFNRKLDNVCEKLDKVGVLGRRGGRRPAGVEPPAERPAEYAVATRLVERPEDLQTVGPGTPHGPPVEAQQRSRFVNKRNMRDISSVLRLCRVLFRHDSGERVEPDAGEVLGEAPGLRRWLVQCSAPPQDHRHRAIIAVVAGAAHLRRPAPRVLFGVASRAPTV